MKKFFVLSMCLIIGPALFIESIREMKNPVKSIRELKENLSSFVN